MDCLIFAMIFAQCLIKCISGLRQLFCYRIKITNNISLDFAVFAAPKSYQNKYSMQA